MLFYFYAFNSTCVIDVQIFLTYCTSRFSVINKTYIVQVSLPSDFTQEMKEDSGFEVPFPTEIPPWVRSLAFSSLNNRLIGRQTYAFKTSGRSGSGDVTYEVFEELQSGATIRSERYIDGREPLLMAATYILVVLEDDGDSGDVTKSLMEMLPKPKPSLWVEKCYDFEQMIAIHFYQSEFDIFDLVLSLSRKLHWKSTPDYFNMVQDGFPPKEAQNIMVPNSTQPTLMQRSTSKLTIIDCPISIEHDFLAGTDIQQSDCYIIDGVCDHGTFVAGIVKQINTNVQILSFPVIQVVVLVDAKELELYQDLEIVHGSQGVKLSTIGLIAKALTSFCNSESKVANLSFGVPNTILEVITFITPCMERLRLKGSILVMAAGNVSVDIDNTANDLFTHFINLPFAYDNREYTMDNIVTVAAVNQYGQLSNFSNFGTKVMLAAPGERIYSCSFPPNQFRVYSGTSFAAPQVAATLAMMVDIFQDETHTQIIHRLIESVDPIIPQNQNDNGGLQVPRIISGGRLNIHRALGYAP